MLSLRRLVGCLSRTQLGFEHIISRCLEKDPSNRYEDYEELEPSVCETIGFLLSDKNDYITLAQNISDDQLLNIITISKMVILEQETLRFTSQEEMVEDAKETS